MRIKLTFGGYRSAQQLGIACIVVYGAAMYESMQSSYMHICMYMCLSKIGNQYITFAV